MGPRHISRLWLFASLLTACVDPAALPTDAGAVDADPARCVPGRTKSCACAGGATGVQVCVASGSFGACDCSAPDSGAPDAAPDVVTPADAPPDVALSDTGPALDATPVDAPMDVARIDVPAIPDVPATPDAGTAPDVFVAPTEQLPPWRAGGCSVWTRVPPALDYSIAADAEGLWALNGTSQILMHRPDDGRWRMAIGPAHGTPAVQPYSSMLPTTGGAVWFDGVGGTFIRRAGAWAPINDPRIPVFSPRAWSWGAEVYAFVPGTGGTPLLLRFDGTRWSELPGLMRELNSFRSAWGDRAAMFVTEADAAWRFDGVTWTGIVRPAVGAVGQFGGPSTSDVYAIGSSALYHLDAGTLRALPDVACGAGVAPAYQQLASAPGRMILVAACGAERRAWNLVGGAFIPLGPLPSAGTVQAQADGRTYLTSPGGVIWSLGPSGWVDLQEAPPPPSGVILGTDIADLIIAGNGVWRYSADRWSAVPGSEAMNVTSAWRSPDGTLFFVNNGSEFWRYVGGRLVHDLPDVPQSRILTGRSSTEVYRSVTDGAYVQQLSRWNGTAWVAMTPPCGRIEQMSLVTSGTSRLVAMCRRDYGRLSESTGGPWTSIGLFDGASTPNLRAFGPAASPTAYRFSTGSNQQRTESGWVPILVSTPPLAGPGPGLDRLIDLTSAGYGRVGTTAGRVDAFFARVAPAAAPERLWSDLRAVLGASYLPFSLSLSESTPAAATLFRCALAP